MESRLQEWEAKIESWATGSSIFGLLRNAESLYQAEQVCPIHFETPGCFVPVPLTLPYPMQVAWGGRGWISKVYVHELVRDSLEIILRRILERLGPDGVRQNGLDQYGGLTNVRMMRGSRTKISRHSFGIPIDINPADNGLRTPWPEKATMPLEAIECFEEEGWISYARVRRKDAMHFQATSNYVGN